MVVQLPPLPFLTLPIMRKMAPQGTIALARLNIICSGMPQRTALPDPISKEGRAGWKEQETSTLGSTLLHCGLLKQAWVGGHESGSSSQLPPCVGGPMVPGMKGLRSFLHKPRSSPFASGE